MGNDGQVNARPGGYDAKLECVMQIGEDFKIFRSIGGEIWGATERMGFKVEVVGGKQGTG